MKNATAETTLLASIPILVILLAVIGAIVYLTLRSNLDVRSRASTPVATPPTVTIAPPTQATPEVACSELYNPVCGSDGTTYNSACLAINAKVNIDHQGPCVSPTNSGPTIVIPKTY